MNWSWYAVKTIYQWKAHGKPKVTDSAYDPNTIVIEERVVLFRARSFDEAIRKAEKEAKEYTADTHINPYGQKVKLRYLNACDAFILYDPPEAGVEVYSITELVCEKIKDKEIIERKLGKEYGQKDRSLRRKFFNKDFSGSIKKHT